MAVTIPEIIEKKKREEKISMLTAYEAPIGRLLDEAGVDIILVGGSLGMVALGYPTTVPVTMDEMIHHSKAVRRVVGRALVVGDMPFMAFNISREETIRNAGRFLKEAGCSAVKVEGGQGSVDSIEAVRAIIDAGSPVLGHLGLTPQTAGRVGGFKVQGKTADAASAILQAAIELQEAGCFGVVLECVPSQVAALITKKLSIPTIGIGAGAECDGQVLVTHDLLGLTAGFYPKFARRFAQLDQSVVKAVKEFTAAISNGTFPSDQESYTMSPQELQRLRQVSGRKRKSKLIKIPKAS